MATPMIPEIIPEQFSHGVDTIPTLNPNVTLSAQDEHRKKLHEAFQKWKLKGFTISQMTDYGCWDKPDAKPNNLNTPIHPLYQPHLWMNGVGLIGNGCSGKWEMRNPIVKKALEPCLRLASLLLLRASTRPFLDGLLMNPWIDVPDSEVQDGCPPNQPRSQARSFHTRDSFFVTFETSQRQSILNNLVKFVRLGIDPHYNSSRDSFVFGYHTARCSRDGSRPEDQRYAESMIWLTSESVIPLLGTLKVSERLVQEFGVAKTLVHETMHFISAYFAHLQGFPPGSSEPFFMNDEISEVGKAWECSVFGGRVCGTVDSPPPFLGCQFGDWPAWQAYKDGKYGGPYGPRFRSTKNFEAGGARDCSVHWPIQLAHFENCQQSAFWINYLAKFGDEIFHPERIVGHKIQRGGISALCTGPAYSSLIDESTGLFLPEPQLPPNASEAEIWLNEQSRIIRAAAINEAARREIIKKRIRSYLKMDPALKAQQEEQDRKEEEQERKLLNLAFATYDPEAEDASAKLYQALEKSRFAVVRAEYFHCYGEFETGGNADWKQRMKRLAHQELFLLNRTGPSFKRIMARKNQIIAKKKAHLDKKLANTANTEAMDTGP